MPDPNKLKVLSDLSYQVRGCCGLCQLGRFAPGSDWGSCKAFTYEHAKHGKKDLSVHRAGVCAADFKVNEKKRADMARSGFDQFQDAFEFSESAGKPEEEDESGLEAACRELEEYVGDPDFNTDRLSKYEHAVMEAAVEEALGKEFWNKVNERLG